MTEIKIKVFGASAIAAVEGELTSGMVGVNVYFEYDSSWSGLDKIAYFKNGELTRKREGVGSSTTVPWEVMRKTGMLEIGLTGKSTDGSVVMPTVWCLVGKIHEGAFSEIPAAPNPDHDPIETQGAIIDDSETSLSKAWSSKKITDMIAHGGTGDINMDGRKIYGVDILDANRVVVRGENSSESFYIEAAKLGDDGYPTANFYSDDKDTYVRLRGIAPGTQNLDAVNKRQMEVALADKAKIDDSKIGADAWSSKNIIDKLCPPINETGLVVQCEAMEGYPLEVQAKEGGEEPGVTVTVCGKNLYDETTYPLSTDGYPYKKIGNFTKSNNYKRTGFIPVQHLAGQTITLNYAPVSATNPGMAFYTRIPNVDSVDDCKDAFCGGGSGYNTNVPADAVYMCFCVAVVDKDKDIQIEIGNKDTDYEPYSENTFTATDEALGAFIPVSGIVGQSGLTTMFAYDGEGKATEVKVFGRADPNAKILRLTEDIAELKAAILTMGANV